MNNAIETNRCYQKFKDILTARHNLSQGSSPVQCYYVRSAASQLPQFRSGKNTHISMISNSVTSAELYQQRNRLYRRKLGSDITAPSADVTEPSTDVTSNG